MYKMKPIIYCLFLITLFSCKKDDVDKRPEFMGLWYSVIDCNGNHASISIDDKSHGVYEVTWEDGYNQKSYEGTIKINDKHVYLGSTKSFDIIEYPHKIDTATEHQNVYYYYSGTHKIANWKMVLYGLKPKAFHICGTWTYYKADY
jgi:hypothetical protein